MMLTDKAKIDFEKWYLLSTDYQKLYKFTVGEIITKHFWSLPKTIKNAIIIDWFDSVGIYIWTMPSLRITNKWTYRIFTNVLETHINQVAYFYDTREKANNKAIIKANEIHNNNQKK